MGNSTFTHLRPEAISDLENATDFTSDEIREYYKRFVGNSDSHSLALRKEEFVNAYSKLFPQGDAKAFASHVYRIYDRDESGEIGKSIYFPFSIALWVHFGAFLLQIFVNFW